MSWNDLHYLLRAWPHLVSLSIRTKLDSEARRTSVRWSVQKPCPISNIRSWAPLRGLKFPPTSSSDQANERPIRLPRTSQRHFRNLSVAQAYSRSVGRLCRNHVVERQRHLGYTLTADAVYSWTYGAVSPLHRPARFRRSDHLPRAFLAIVNWVARG